MATRTTKTSAATKKAVEKKPTTKTVSKKQTGRQKRNPSPVPTTKKTGARTTGKTASAAHVRQSAKKSSASGSSARTTSIKVGSKPAANKTRVTPEKLPTVPKVAVKRSASAKRVLNIKDTKRSKPTGKKQEEKQKRRLPACILTGIVCALLGILIGFYPLGSGFSLSGRTTIPESDLDKPVGMYIINGVPNFVTARQALDEGAGLSAALQEDGTYAYPTADEILSSVRTAVLNGEVTARGITVTQNEMKDYAQSQLGTSDFSVVAQHYGLDQESVQLFVRQAAGIKKLRDEVTGLKDQTAPTAPEQNQDSAVYKAYIIDILGSDWNAEQNTWANENNDYFTSLGGTAFAPDQATYEQASTVYSIAMKDYQADSAEAAQIWNAFVNDALKNCQVRISEAIL